MLYNEPIFLHNNITIIPPSVLYVSLSYHTINLCISASIRFDDYFSIFMLSPYAACDNILLV
ncbi:HN1_G0039300.mRNA.1.CDS.1 [Saccharomyces cerevisiae]|nr:HN1_G0039300.mRNA.1.CDS.1 [Saccharomyces cerevisiae]